MADQIGIIDSSKIKEKSQHKQEHKKHRHKKHRHGHDHDLYEEFGKKGVPEPVLLTREIERRKDIQKAKEKQRRKKEKMRQQTRNPGKYGKKYYGGYDSSSDDDMNFKGISGFGKSGSYSYKQAAFGGQGKRAVFTQRGWGKK